jgi:hypothetical protein
MIVTGHLQCLIVHWLLLDDGQGSCSMTLNWLLHLMIDRDLLDDCHRVPALEPKWLWAMAVFYACSFLIQAALPHGYDCSCCRSQRNKTNKRAAILA